MDSLPCVERKRRDTRGPIAGLTDRKGMDWRRYDAGTRLSQALLQRWPLVAEAAGAVPHNPRHSTNRAPYRRAATYVDCVLRGEKPGDLPVQFPTKFEMIVNRRTANALGLAVPPLRVDEVID